MFSVVVGFFAPLEVSLKAWETAPGSNLGIRWGSLSISGQGEWCGHQPPQSENQIHFAGVSAADQAEVLKAKPPGLHKHLWAAFAMDGASDEMGAFRAVWP